MKFSSITNATIGELKKQKKEFEEQLFHAKMSNVLGRQSNTLLVRTLRRDVARVMTAIRQKSLNKDGLK